MRFPRAMLIVLAASFLLPAADAHHRCEIMCLGGLWHEEGEGLCPGDARRSYFILGGESHTEAVGLDAIAGAGWTCEDSGAGMERRTGVFLYAWEEGEPAALVFIGIEENPRGCGVALGIVYVEQASPNSVLCTIA